MLIVIRTTILLQRYCYTLALILLDTRQTGNMYTICKIILIIIKANRLAARKRTSLIIVHICTLHYYIHCEGIVQRGVHHLLEAALGCDGYCMYREKNRGRYTVSSTRPTKRHDCKGYGCSVEESSCKTWVSKVRMSIYYRYIIGQRRYQFFRTMTRIVFMSRRNIEQLFIILSYTPHSQYAIFYCNWWVLHLYVFVF